MIDRVVYRRPEWATVLGSGLVLIGLALFMIVFVTLFPILRDPVTAYDRWFPAVEDRPTVVVAAADDDVVRAEPLARFRWEAIVVESVNPAVYRLRLESTSIPGQADLVAWRWDFGDGTSSGGETVVHDYVQYGSYIVTLTVEDADGATNTLAGEVAIPGVDETTGTTGQVDELLNLDIESSLSDAVGSVGDEISATIDGALGSIGRTARGAVVVFLFALAAFATTIVAWRIARVGVMVLTGNPARPRQDRQPPPPADEEPRGERQLELV
ncbi:MAG: PKD domain-containing protein [Acidimicrobiia bacterium]|nr:PKD domain-containing protein [Acidimicrobiia bacterium]